MRNGFNWQLPLGFALGVLILTFLLCVTSYQIERCTQLNSKSGGGQNTQIDFPSALDQEPTKKEPGDVDGEPVACGIIGFPSATMHFMDKNEGFFVGLFTFALFLVTYQLWLSTDKLWRESKEQIELQRREFNITHRPKLVVRNLRLLPDGRGSFTAVYEIVNIGESNAITAFQHIVIEIMPSNKTGGIKIIRDLDVPKTVAGQRNLVWIGFGADNEYEVTWNKINEGSLTFRGCITYEDSIGISRETSFYRTWSESEKRFLRSDNPEEEYAD